MCPGRGRRRASVMRTQIASRVLSVAIVLMAVAALGSAAFTAVTAVTSRRAGAALPGYNGLIAFEAHRDGHAEIYVMNAGGAAPTRLTDSTPNGFDPTNGQPSWSPDGTKIAFASGRDG